MIPTKQTAPLLEGLVELAARDIGVMLVVCRAVLLSTPVVELVRGLVDERDEMRDAGARLALKLTETSGRYLRRAEAAESERAALLRRIGDAEAEPVLPCDVTLGNCTFRKGVKMAVLQRKLTRMYKRYAGLARHWAERSVTPLPSIEDTDND